VFGFLRGGCKVSGKGTISSMREVKRAGRRPVSLNKEGRAAGASRKRRLRRPCQLSTKGTPRGVRVSGRGRTREKEFGP